MFPCVHVSPGHWSENWNIPVTWKLVRNANSCDLLQTYELETLGVVPSNLCFNKLSRWFWWMVQFEVHCSRAGGQQNWPVGQILVAGCFCMACELQLFFELYFYLFYFISLLYIFEQLKKIKRGIISWHRKIIWNIHFRVHK